MGVCFLESVLYTCTYSLQHVTQEWTQGNVCTYVGMHTTPPLHVQVLCTIYQKEQILHVYSSN